VNDPDWGLMFIRMCPYFPFSARICLNQHNWLAIRMRQEGIDFQQSKNAFLKCSNPRRLQELADTLTPKDLVKCGQKWLAALTPFFTPRERREGGCQHRLFISQAEYCDNLIFFRQAALDNLAQRLLDMNRTIGQPNKITAKLRERTSTIIDRYYDAQQDILQSFVDRGQLRKLTEPSERVYAPLTAGLLKPFNGDRKMPDEKLCELDRL
jgi:hypothetical protein